MAGSGDLAGQFPLGSVGGALQTVLPMPNLADSCSNKNPWDLYIMDTHIYIYIYIHTPKLSSCGHIGCICWP